ncbi:hypothetical protein [Haloprofundus salilacus]|uniref:hypothetical protein n=1 Tax=Haloprofundus salilacus TaxID=2876190 RepID=UPI001CCD8E73|nr:hypothetical protein [Haloprofundus salilacus]
MAQSAVLLSVLFGILLVATVAYISRYEWQRYTVASGGISSRASERSVASLTANSPVAWSVAFLLAVVSVGAATVVFVSGASAPRWAVQTAGAFLAAGSVFGLALYLLYGSFVSARGRGLNRAQAAAVGSWALGLLVITAVVVKLLGFL